MLLGTVALAQRRGTMSQSSTEIQVHVSYTDERPVGRQIQVDLLNEQSIPIQQTFTDSEGRATFTIMGGGVYRVRASGQAIETATSDPMNIEPSDHTAIAWVHVQAKPGTAGDNNVSYNIADAHELKVPSNARKCFMKGLDAFQHHDYQKASDLFEKATAAYPQYDAAYDNLGVVYMQLKQPDKAREAFARAVELNDKNADADRNYARLLIAAKDYPRAADVLTKSLMVDPQNPSALTMLSIARFQTHDFDGALQSALKVHDVPHGGYAIVHYVAGRAYELKGDYSKATAQYETYLKEDPKGPQAQQVQNALTRVTASGGSPAKPVATPQ
jgi:tetratricopeptide (TPR) repeat protein